MEVDVTMPQLGESIAEGTIARWLKHEGEEVKRDESLVEVTTDKVDVEIPSPATGVITKIFAGEDETIAVGQRIAVIDTEAKVGALSGETPGPAPMTEAKKEEPAAAEVTRLEAAPPRKLEKQVFSPIVKELAKKYGIDASVLRGTGTGGRVTKKDVMKYLEERKISRPAVEAPVRVESEEVPAVTERLREKKDRAVPLRGMRKTIAEHLALSKQVIPHVTTVAEVDMTRLVELREKWKETYQERGIHLTYMPFIIQAAARALLKYPLLNASLVEDHIVYHGRIHIGVAVSLPGGLIVPVIKDADEKSIEELALEVQDLAERARSGRLKPDEVKGGTFTITNPGSLGAVLSTPIINYPEAAILSVERLAKEPAVIDDAITIRWMMNLCLSYDHRIIDGAEAIAFLQEIKRCLEKADFEMGRMGRES